VSLSASLLEDLADVTGLEVVTDPHVTGPYAHDWWPRMLMRRRAGEELPTPDAVVAPQSRDDVVAVVRWCAANRVALVPFGAGTGVCGGANPVTGALTVDLKHLTAIGPLDEVSGVIEVEPGVIGQRLEEHLVHRGWTLGHHPSSAHASTIGGFLAVRSAGQASSLHGKLEDTVIGLEVVLADGQVLTSRPVPQSSSGPDLTRLFLGGEGTTGIITRAWLRVRPAAETTLDRGWLVPDLQAGLDAMRAIVRTGTMPAVLRLYDEPDTGVVFGGQGLPVPDGCLLVVGCEGRADVAAFTEQVATGELTRLGATDLGRGPGEHWRAHRHGMSYRFADYVKPGGTFGDALTLDTMEVAGLWRDLPELYVAVRDALQAHVDLVLAHVSHVYDTGASIYYTLGAVNEGDEAQALARYDAAWEAGQRAALAAGATASHHHGVGLLRAPYLPEELGPAGFDVLRRVKDALDPDHLLNPGKLGLGGPS
jgi:alkyldihydroxyacetonephosphate synthase